MDTPEARALAQARAHAQATLARYHSGDIDRTDAYWAGALAEALRILLNATAGEG